MPGRSMTRAILGVSLVVGSLVAALPAAAAPVDLTDDGTGKRWRSLTDTVALSVDQVAQVCPLDGETRCAGSVGGKDLTGWVWATADQVVALFGLYDPAILTAESPSVGGAEHFGMAVEFLTDMRPTFSVTGYNFHHSFAGGWTSSSDPAGQPAAGGVGFGWYPISGSFFVGPVANPPASWYGVWLWRPSSDDITPPAITPAVSGTLGTNGWYVSNVSVAWDVRDAESVVSAQTGCDPTTLTTDTIGTTLTCAATSSGGSASQSAVVKRDTIAADRDVRNATASLRDLSTRRVGAGVRS